MGSRQPSNTKPETTAKKQENDRLARALRENLRRRKAQARARTKSLTLDTGKIANSNGQIKQ